MQNIKQLTKDQLRKAFQQAFGNPPPKKASREFLVGNLAYHQQAKEYGDLSAKTHKLLLALGEDASNRPNTRIPRTHPGTKLIRMWQGEPYEVTVIGTKQFIYRGETYSSLSAIATHITGTRWNGHIFFGLKKEPARGS